MKCPFDKKECIKGECEIYSNIYEETCGINAIALLLNDIEEQGESV